MKIGHVGTLIAVLWLCMPSSPAAAQAGGDPANIGGWMAQVGTVIGRVVDDTGEPVAAATVRLIDLGRGELSHQNGSFHFERVPAGSYTIAVQRLGYAPAQRSVVVVAGDTTRLEIGLRPSAIDLPGVVVTGVGRERSATEAYRPTTVLDEAELRRQLGSSVAATLANQPGISQRYNGPAASQPVIRGLGGDRVLVLEDGNRTGDIASTSADHAVTIEPLTAERIEVLRGPAGLMYGSNALGGVINIVREEVPRTLPEQISGMVTAQVQSVNSGATAGGSLVGALGHLAVRGELTGRTASDTRTPLGPLPSSGMNGYNGALGASWIRPDGFVGASVRDYVIEYGVPGTFGGQTIPGAHEGGVDIELRRTAARAEAGLMSGAGPFSAIEWDGQYTRFEQDEIERGGAVGTSFGQLTAASSLTAHHRHEIGGVLTEGAIGASGLWQDHRTAGNSGSEPAQQVSLAGYIFEELGRGPLRVQVGGRYDWIRIDPLEPGSSFAGDIRRREFGAVSGSVATLYEIRQAIVLGTSLSRAFRTPSIPELFSSGPHLADYSFNIGNPDLEAEYGLGLDVFARLNLEGVNAEVAVYRNWISDYIYYAPTGELDPRLQRFPVYRAEGDDAMLEGFEGRIQWEALERVVLDATGSYVRGTRTGDAEPLPAIPPLHGSVTARYDERRFFASATVAGTAAQERVGEFEEPTPGHTLLHLGGGFRWSAWGDLHTLTLRVSNATDAVWRDHLSRIRAVAPQPGRSAELLYRVGF